jgi:hypothetical protein
MVREVTLISSSAAKKIIIVKKTRNSMNGWKINNGEP